MRTSSKDSKAAYQRCPETCQKVRTEISEALEQVLVNEGFDFPAFVISRLTDAAFDAALAHGAEPLRSALIDCEEELREAREALDAAEDDARYEKSRADSLEGDVARLESELDSATSIGDSLRS